MSFNVTRGMKNLLAYSEELDNGYYNTVSYPCVITPNAILAPNGKLSADLITASGGNARHGIYHSSAIPAPYVGQISTVSCYILKNTSDFAWVGEAGDSLWHGAMFNVNLGTYISTYPAGTIESYVITPTGDYFRISVTSRRSATGNFTPLFGVGDSGGNYVFTPNATAESVYVWGVQHNYGHLADDYVHTREVPIT